MSDLEVVSLPNGQFAENCYLVADRRTSEAVIIDPGEEPDMFLAELDTRAWTLRAIWLTHAHVDHILGVADVKEATGVPIHLHPADRRIYDAMPQFGAWLGKELLVPPPPDVDLEPGPRSGSVGSISRCGSPRATRPAASASSETAWCSAATCCSTAPSAGPICLAAISTR